ncbi:MAG TPA: hypothetical protein VFU55_05245 [Terracidiphilus sp.]|nr:hypothetical protein [Terracidiphilus sp.]
MWFSKLFEMKSGQTQEADPESASKSARGFLIGMWLLAAIGSLLILLYSLRFQGSGDVLRIFAVGMLVAGAALLSGYLLGFVFAVPRLGDRQGKAAAAGQGGVQPSAFVVQSNPLYNGNLVEISDWLTKILVGVGLVELKSIAGNLGKLSYYLAPALQPAPCTANALCADPLISGQAAGLAIILFYFALGFLLGWIWTTVYLLRDLTKGLEKRNRTLDLIAKAEGALANGRFDEALNYANQAIESDPKSAVAVVTKARALKRKADKVNYQSQEGKAFLNQAVALIDWAIALAPDKGESFYNKACYQALLGTVPDDVVLANLKSAFRLKPVLLQDAKTPDPDLDSLKDNADFKALISESGAPGA